MNNEEREKILTALLDVSRCANKMPKLGDGFEIYTSYSHFADVLKDEGRRLRSLLNEVLKRTNTKNSIGLSDSKEDMFETLEKANDFLAERIANCIDEAEGRRKPEELIVVSAETSSSSAQNTQITSTTLISTSWNRLSALADKTPKATSVLSTVGTERSMDFQLKLLGGKNVARPQIEFQHLIDNSRRPFVSKLKFKHNARTEIERLGLTLHDGDAAQSGAEKWASDVAQCAHPYKYELDHFEADPKFLNRVVDVKMPNENEDRPLTLIEDEPALIKLCSLLCSLSEFAVDLEHHSYRSFQGLTCLLQISTREEDFIVDTLKLWTSMHFLNEPFTKPEVLKVFHGADHDIEWLQRDFGIYVVNMFDTSQAMRVLGMARFSLAHLVKTYVGKDLNKQFQLADWRIRPLPKALVDYAREDTRFLLYCFDRLKNDLIDAGNEQKNLLLSVFDRSRIICSKTYEKPSFDDDSDHLKLCTYSKRPFNASQKLALKELYAWRDATARLHDESTAFVLPDHMMLQMASVLPREMHGLLSCCNPVPPLVKQELNELHKIILKARLSSPAELSRQPTVLDPVARPSFLNAIKAISRPLDFSHCAEEEELAPLQLNDPRDSAALVEEHPVIDLVPNRNKRRKRQAEVSVFVAPFRLFSEAEKALLLQPAQADNDTQQPVHPNTETATSVLSKQQEEKLMFIKPVLQEGNVIKRKKRKIKDAF